MIENIKNKKVYSYCLASVVTGGCELIHQLTDFLNNHGRNAYIVYVGEQSHEVPEPYSKYNIKVSETIEDSDDTIIVCGEGFLYKALQFKHAHVILWWLSVDNAFNDGVQLPYMSLRDAFSWNIRAGLRCVKLRLKRGILFKSFSLRQIRNIDAINAYQSEYARLFLKSLGFKNLVPLKDYINTTFSQSDSSSSKRKPQVLYNPRKGYKYTKNLIALAPDLAWKPLQGMNREQLLETLKTSMLYIDFGNHPGKDRLPREVALNGCCVITGRRGAAKNDVDIPLPTGYKFDENLVPPQRIIDRIRYVLDNYETCVKEMNDYRKHILLEKEEFEQQIISLFGLANKITPP